MRSAKQDCEALIDELLPFAKQMLGEFGEFHPFGGTLSPSDNLVHVGATTGEEFPPGKALREVMQKAFRNGATAGKFKATAVVCNVRVVPPGEPDSRDAIQFELDHRDGYSAIVFFPYTLSDDGVLTVAPPFACRGEGRLFVPS